MKKIILVILSLINFSLISMAQEVQWTKDARNIVYNELLNELTNYKILIPEQKESIALCGLEEITKKYPMAMYQAKIDVELKRIKSSTISQCSKNIGVDLEKANNNQPIKNKVEWTKESKSVYYIEVFNFLNKYDLTTSEREKVSLCFVDELSKSYSKVELDNLIDAELKKIKNDYFKKCLEANNVILKKQIENKLDKKSLMGCWQSYDFSLCFFEDGTIEKKLDKGFIKKSKGKWFLELEKIILINKDTKEEYRVVYFSGDSMKLEEVNSKKVLHFTKMFNF